MVRPARRLSLLALAAALAAIPIACTHDFDAFEPRTDADAAPEAQPSDATPPPTDAAPASDASPAPQNV